MAVVERTARQQSAVVTASVGDSQAQQTILVNPGTAPVLSAPGRQIAKKGTGVDFTVTASDPGELPMQLNVQGAPAGATFDAGTGHFHWVPTASQTGRYKVTFSATNSASQSSSVVVPVEVDSGEPSLDAQTLSCSPGAVARLRGRWLAASRTALADPTGNSMSLGGTTVEVNGVPTPVVFLSDTAVEFLCPDLSAGTPLSVKVASESGPTDTLTGTMLEATPAIATLDDSVQGQGLISLSATKKLAMYRNFQISAEPAQPGDEISITATGLSSAAGGASNHVVVKVSGIDATVESVTPLAGTAGFYTIRARVPAAVAFGDGVPVQVQVVTSDGRQFASNSATLTVEPVRN